MRHWFVDFETRSCCDLKAAGIAVYAVHPSTEVLCLAYAEGEKPVSLWTPGMKPPEPLVAAAARGDLFHAHNAMFEFYIWNSLLTDLGFPVLPIGRWRCTAARAAASALPRDLARAAKALGLVQQKDQDGKRVMMKLSRPRKPTKNNDSPWHTDPDDFKTLFEYCIQDVQVERAIHNALPPLTPFEEQLWCIDLAINHRGVLIDTEMAAGAVKVWAEHAKRLVKRLAEVTGGAVTTGRQIDRMLKWLHSHGVNIADLTAPTVKESLAGELPEAAREVLTIRQELSQSSVAKYEAMLAQTVVDDRVRGIHLYCGAERTGRWAGRGIQTQNIPRGELKINDYDWAAAMVATGDLGVVERELGPVPKALVAMIRPAIRAAEGKRLLVVDYAAIEARVLAWLARQQDLIQQFRDGHDVYIALAAKVYGIEPSEVTKQQRTVGKVAVLGLGYGMGAKKFLATCAKYGIEVEETLAEQVVKVYRDANKRIQSFWYDLEAACVEAVDEGRCTRVGRLTCRIEDRWLTIELPSGRKLRYFDPKCEDGETPWGKKVRKLTFMGLDVNKRWVRQETYGGKLVENVTQATARDLLAEGIVRLEGYGYPVVMHVHDEVVCEVEWWRGSITAMEAILCELPEWAAGLPIQAEGFETTRYKK
jgi:DNA polymerase bacteriophage-type